MSNLLSHILQLLNAHPSSFGSQTLENYAVFLDAAHLFSFYKYSRIPIPNLICSYCSNSNFIPIHCAAQFTYLLLLSLTSLAFQLWAAIQLQAPSATTTTLSLRRSALCAFALLVPSHSYAKPRTSFLSPLQLILQLFTSVRQLFCISPPSLP